MAPRAWLARRRGGHARSVSPAQRLLAVLLAIGLLAFPAAAVYAQSEPAQPLTPERYAPIDAVYTAGIGLSSRRVTKAKIGAATAACEGLSADDALLGPLRKSCSATVAASTTSLAFGRCASPEACRRDSAQLREALTAVVATSRTANRAIRASVTDRECRAQLRTTAAELQAARRTIAGLRTLELALRTGSSRDLERANDRLSAVGTEKVSATRERRRFRAACR